MTSGLAPFESGWEGSFGNVDCRLVYGNVTRERTVSRRRRSSGRGHLYVIGLSERPPSQPFDDMDTEARWCRRLVSDRGGAESLYMSSGIRVGLTSCMVIVGFSPRALNMWVSKSSMTGKKIARTV